MIVRVLSTRARTGAASVVSEYSYGASVALSIMLPDVGSHRAGIELAGRVGLGVPTRRSLYEHALTYDCDCDVQLEPEFDLVLDGLERLRSW